MDAQPYIQKQPRSKRWTQRLTAALVSVLPQRASTALRSTVSASWLLVLVIVIQAMIAMYSIYILSAVRTYVGGESLWSKGQKDAIYQLTRYAHTGDKDAYNDYLKVIQIPLGDQAARHAVLRDTPNNDAARAGFILGGNHPDDLGGVIYLLKYFHNTSLMQDSIANWEVGDRYIQEITGLADEIHKKWQVGPISESTKLAWLIRINQINDEITPFAKAFSDALGNSSRLIVKILMWTTIVTACLMIGLIVWRNSLLIKQRERVQQALDNERLRARVTLAAIGDGVITTDAQGIITYMNRAAEQILATSTPITTGKPVAEVLQFPHASPSYLSRLAQEASQADQPLKASFIHQLHRHDEESIAVRVMVSSMSGIEGNISGQVVVLHDATQEQNFLDQLSWYANHDSLTGLLNRRAFENKVAHALTQQRFAGLEGVLLYMDVDQFKLVNDTCGHQAGDYVLREICGILQSNLREAHTLARLGGDEFGLLLENQSLTEGLAVAERLRHVVKNARFRWLDRELSTGLSIGIVPLLAQFDTIQEVMRVADIAGYQAKENGRNRVCIYEPHNAQFSRVQGEMDWIRRLRNALDSNRFELYAQTITNLQSDTANEQGMHVELLLRLRDENGHMAPPSEFIPAAEMYGLMPEIDRWVIQHAFCHLASTPLLDGKPITVCAINLSATSIGDNDLLEFIREQFAISKINPAQICFEITETSAITKLTEAQYLMHALREMGCSFALDDFGAGMSSFRYLQNLHVDYLKIDGSLISVMLNDSHNRAMVEMINHLAKTMKMKTIAEFADSQAIIQELSLMGVDYAQGYALCRPQPFMRIA